MANKKTLSDDLKKAKAWYGTRKRQELQLSVGVLEMNKNFTVKSQRWKSKGEIQIAKNWLSSNLQFNYILLLEPTLNTYIHTISNHIL